jgi:UDP-glucuronate 4-epimerase
MKILVTGGAGFVGSHLIERLLKSTSSSIICLDNFNDYYDPALKRANVRQFADDPRLTLIEASFCDNDRMRRLFADHRPTHVLHLGAYAGVRPSVQNPFIYQEANVRGTLVLLEAARANPVERFVFTSSSTVYGNRVAIPFNEDKPLGIPMSPYGATKRAAELMGLTYFDLHELPFVCLRPFSVYGPRLRPDLALTIFTEAIATGRRLPLFGDGSIRRDFTHVSDICDGIIAAMTADHVIGECINLGHSDPIEIREVISLLEDALGRTANIDRLPSAPGDLPVTFADLDKAERLLGYHPKVAFADGIKEFVEWYTQWHGIDAGRSTTSAMQS